MPENTLQAFANHGDIGAAMPPDGGHAERDLERFTLAGIDLYALAEQLQREGAAWESSPGTTFSTASRTRPLSLKSCK